MIELFLELICMVQWLYVFVMYVIICRFTLKHVCGMVNAYSHCTIQISCHNKTQSFGQFGQMVEC